MLRSEKDNKGQTWSVWKIRNRRNQEQNDNMKTQKKYG